MVRFTVYAEEVAGVAVDEVIRELMVFETGVDGVREVAEYVEEEVE